MCISVVRERGVILILLFYIGISAEGVGVVWSPIPSSAFTHGEI